MSFRPRSFLPSAVILAVVLMVSLPLSAAAQKVITRTISGSACIIPGLGAIITEDSGKIVVSMVPPVEQRPKEYQDVDLQNDDVIMMFNGRKVTSIADFQTRLDSIAVGGEIKLGILRGDGRYLAVLTKAEVSKDSGAHVMVMSGAGGASAPSGAAGVYSSAGGQPVAIALEASALLSESDSGLCVMQLLPDDSVPTGGKAVKAGYLLVAVQDRQVKTVAEFTAVYDAVKPGDTFTLSFRHGQETFANKYVRSAAKPAVQIRTR